MEQDSLLSPLSVSCTSSPAGVGQGGSIWGLGPTCLSLFPPAAYLCTHIHAHTHTGHERGLGSLQMRATTRAFGRYAMSSVGPLPTPESKARLLTLCCDARAT